MNNKLYFYGGLDTVGSVHVIYQHGNVGLLFDAGIAHKGLFRAPFIHLNDRLQPTKGLELEQYLLNKMAPPIQELYDESATTHITQEDLLALWEKDHFPAFEKMYVFISHMHQDHMALLPFFRENVTVYMHELSYATYQAMVEANYYMDTKATIVTFHTNETIELDGFSLQTMEVDHNILGTSGFLLHSNEGKIAFTADWRMHGHHQQKMQQFISTCQEASVDILLTETTKVTPTSAEKASEAKAESTVLEQFEELIAQQKGLTYLLALPLDVERMINMILIADRQEKILILDQQIAHFWRQIRKEEALFKAIDDFSAVEDRVIRVLSHQSTSTKSSSYRQVGIKEIVHDKQRYIFHLTFTSIPLFIQMERLGEKGNASIFIHANCPADQQLLQTWLTAFNIRYHNISNAGHATHQDIIDLTEQINPKVIIPIHGNQPHMLKSNKENVYLPTYGEEVVIRELIQGEEKQANEIY